MLDHAVNHILKRSTSISRHHLLLGCQDRENEIVRWVLIPSYLRQIIYLLLAYRYSVIHLLTVQINEPLRVLRLIDLIENLPRDIPMDLLFRLLVLLHRHGIVILIRVLVFPLQIIVHLRLNIIILLLNIVVALLGHLLDLLRVHGVLARQLEVRGHVLVRLDYLRVPEAHVWLQP